MTDARRSAAGRMAIGVAAALVFGGLGLFAWLVWIWVETPSEVRATIGPGARASVVAVATMGLAASFVGVAMTAAALHHAFEAIGSADPSDKARLLAEGISEAMNWTVFGLLTLLVAAIIVLVAGFRLLRASAPVTT